MSPHRYSRFFPFIFLGADLIALIGSIFLFKLFVLENFNVLDISWKIWLGLIMGWLAIFYGGKLYEITRELILWKYFEKLFFSLFSFGILAVLMWSMTGYPTKMLLGIGTYFAAFSALLLFWRIIWFVAIRWYRSLGYNFRRVLIVGKNETTNNLANHINNSRFLGYKLEGFIDDVHEGIGGIVNLERVVESRKVDIIFCFTPVIEEKRLMEILHFAENNLVQVKLLSQFSSFPDRRFTVQKYGSISALNVTAIPLDSILNRAIKRLFDVVFSSLVILLILSWLLPLIGLLIKIDSPGPIFFKQSRNGRGDKLFTIFKFRSMKLHDQSKLKQATKDDTRITRLGSFLRKSSIDELPQFFNVFLGQMSVVGPRPHVMQQNIEFRRKVDKFLQRHSVKPGITGLAQAKGFRGEILDRWDLEGRVRLDRFYVRSWTMILDIKIIFWTINSILFKNEKAY